MCALQLETVRQIMYENRTTMMYVNKESKKLLDEVGSVGKLLQESQHLRRG